MSTTVTILEDVVTLVQAVEQGPPGPPGPQGVAGDLAGSITTPSFWDDFSFPLTQTRVNPSTNLPAFNYDEGAFVFPQNTPSQILHATAQLPHRWHEGSTIYPHVHWMQNQNQPVTWKIDYRWTNIGAVVSGDWTTYVMATPAIAYPGSGTIHQVSHGTGGIDGTGKTISSALQIRIYRDDNVYSGSALATMMDFHIVSDALGSALEYVK